MVGQRRFLVDICPKFLIKNLHFTTKFMHLCIVSPRVVMNKLWWMVVMDRFFFFSSASWWKWGVEHVFLCWIFCFNIIIHLMFNPSYIFGTIYFNLSSMFMMTTPTIAHILGEWGFFQSQCIIVQQFVFFCTFIFQFVIFY